MDQWLKDHFIPHKDNDFQPHFLRLKMAALLLALIGLLEVAYLANTLFLIPRSDQFAAIFAAVLVDQTNTERTGADLDHLLHNPLLEAAAQKKADDMAAKGYFSHVSPDGKTPWYWFDLVGYDYAAAGENLAVNFTDSKDVTEAWMRSPSHRANIMNDNYTEVGIATARGMYKGKEAIFVVQEFGRPSLVAREIEKASSTVSALSDLITKEVVPVMIAVAPKVVENTAPQVAPAAVVNDAAPEVPEPLPAPVAPKEVTGIDRTIVAGAEAVKLAVEAAPVIASGTDAPKTTSWERAITAPRQLTTIVLGIIGTLIALALILAIVIEIRIQHTHLILNGALLLLFLGSLIMMNTLIGVTQGVI